MNTGKSTATFTFVDVQSCTSVNFNKIIKNFNTYGGRGILASTLYVVLDNTMWGVHAKNSLPTMVLSTYCNHLTEVLALRPDMVLHNTMWGLHTKIFLYFFATILLFKRFQTN